MWKNVHPVSGAGIWTHLWKIKISNFANCRYDFGFQTLPFRKYIHLFIFPVMRFSPMTIRLYNKVQKGCHHSSVDSSAPSILQPRVQVPWTPSTLFFNLHCSNCLLAIWIGMWKKENKQKEAVIGPFLKKIYVFLYGTQEKFDKRFKYVIVGDFHGVTSLRTNAA